MVQIKELFRETRFPTGWKLIPLIIYVPIGIILAVLRLFIGLQAILAASMLTRISVVRTYVLRIMCAVLGIVVCQENIQDRDRTVRIIVSNHLSIFDHLAIHLITGSISVNVWELPFCFHHALSLKDFGKAKEKDVLINNIKVHLNKEESPVDIQPEGEPTSGKVGILRFSSWPFGIGKTVQPVSVKIWRPPLTEIAPAIVSAPWSSDLFWFLFVPLTIFTIKYLPTVERGSNESEDEMARRVERMIADDLAVDVTNYTSGDKAEYVKRLSVVRNRVPAGRSSLGHSSVIHNDRVLTEMTHKVKQVLPHVPVKTILLDLVKTRSVDVTISNILEGLVEFTPETQAETSSSRTVPDRSKTSLEVKPTKSSSNSGGCVPEKMFPKQAHERMLSFQERKRRLIETARKKYIEKHALNVINSS